MIKSIHLSNFRNFGKKSVDFSEGINIIVAPNASGKTNILESIFLLATGKSFKAKVDAETISYNESITRLRSTSYDGQARTDLEVVITTGENGWPRKKFLVNGVSRRLLDFAGNFKAVLFGPWDLDLVTESPSTRRKFLDTVLSITDREYRRALGSYEKGLRQRNKLLLRIREEGVNRSHLLFWNQLLVKNGNYISQQRRKFIDFANAGNLQFPITNYQLEYDASAISEARLEQYKNEEVASATTLVGPHRDDIVFKLNNRNLSSFGSRGEQRLGVLWVKMAELSYVEARTEVKPTLLLDDIFSELDHEHRKLVIDTIQNHQVIMTTADSHYVPEEITNSKLKIINL
jgi:DNA replication and repair protein RecF